MRWFDTYVFPNGYDVLHLTQLPFCCSYVKNALLSQQLLSMNPSLVNYSHRVEHQTPELTCLITRSLYPWTDISPFLPPLGSWQLLSISTTTMFLTPHVSELTQHCLLLPSATAPRDVYRKCSWSNFSWNLGQEMTLLIKGENSPLGWRLHYRGCCQSEKADKELWSWETRPASHQHFH